MSLINVTNLTFSYDGSYNIFENVSFQIDTNWRLGFIGRNGRGKTTFLKLLMGEYEYNGVISGAGIDFDYFPFIVQDSTVNTIDVIKNTAPGFELWQLKKELSLLEVKEDCLYYPFNTLSGGECTKILLAALFLKENNFLLLDEPTNHLDLKARKIVSDYLKQKSFILVSHDRAFLDNCIDHVLSINKKDIEIQRGNFSTWYHNRQMQDDYEEAANRQLNKDIKKLETATKRTASWSDKGEKTKFASHNNGEKPADRGFIGHKSAKMMKRSKAANSRKEKAIEEKSKLLSNIETTDSLKLCPLSHHKETLVELKGVSVSYCRKPVFKNISFTLNQGDRISLSGKNGSGKTTLLKLLAGEEISYEGSLMPASNLVISYVCQDPSGLHGDLKGFIEKAGINESQFKAILRKLGFNREQFDKDMKDFSSGQKKKVLLAKSLCEKAHIYIWDEPLNYVDIISRIQIEDLLVNYKPTMVFVEHDSEFSRKVSTKTVALEHHPIF